MPDTSWWVIKYTLWVYIISDLPNYKHDKDNM